MKIEYSQPTCEMSDLKPGDTFIRVQLPGRIYLKIVELDWNVVDLGQAVLLKLSPSEKVKKMKCKVVVDES